MLTVFNANVTLKKKNTNVTFLMLTLLFLNANITCVRSGFGAFCSCFGTLTVYLSLHVELPLCIGIPYVIC